MGIERKQLKNDSEMQTHYVASLNLPPIPVVVADAFGGDVTGSKSGVKNKIRRPVWGGKFIGLYRGDSSVQSSLHQLNQQEQELPALPVDARYSRSVIEPLHLPLVASAESISHDVVANHLSVDRFKKSIDFFKTWLTKNLGIEVKQTVVAKKLRPEPKEISRTEFLDKLYRETLPQLSREILEKARIDGELVSALRELCDLKEKVRGRLLTAENLGCSSKDLDAILKSAKATQILHRLGLPLGR